MHELSHDTSPIASADECEATDYLRMFSEYVLEPTFPCLGAKAAVGGGKATVRCYRAQDLDANLEALAKDLAAFVMARQSPPSDFAVLAAIFPLHRIDDEAVFEDFVWKSLRKLHRLDKSTWDTKYSAIATESSFKFSFAGRAFYVVGMNPKASRVARRFPSPTLVFNPVWQFERLRAMNQLDRLAKIIRRRDMNLQGSINPNLHFESICSDALQYSGRPVDVTWKCPFPEEPRG